MFAVQAPDLDDKWIQRFLRLAQYIANEWSKDPSTKVGTVIVDKYRRVISLGYNGFARGVSDTEERLNTKEEKYPRTVHAEMNAVLSATASLDEKILITTMFPCSSCTKMILQTGIGMVCAPPPINRSPWAEDALISLSMFKEAGRYLRLIDGE